MDFDSGIIAALGAAIIFVVLIVVVCYVLYAYSHMKALKAVGYDKAWMAWIPFANYYALADAAADGAESVALFGTLNVPAILYKLWWLAAFILSFIPTIGSLLNLVLTVVFLGNCYVKLYARLDGKTEQETQVLGYVSGFLQIIAVFKFLFGKYNA